MFFFFYCPEFQFKLSQVVQLSNVEMQSSLVKTAAWALVVNFKPAVITIQSDDILIHYMQIRPSSQYLNSL